MAENHEREITISQQVSGKTMAGASITAVAVAGPLLCVTGLSFVATATLALISSPLLLIFSPLLLFGGFVLVSAVGGFVAATAMGLAGVSAFVWMAREFIGHVGFGEKVREKGRDWAVFLKEKLSSQDHSVDNWTDRG